MNKFGFVRVGSASLKTTVASAMKNAEEIIKVIDEAILNEVAILVFPELCITGYTCADLFFQQTLIESNLKALKTICDSTKGKDIVVIVGAVIPYYNKLYNSAVVIQDGSYMGIVPKTYLPNYSEFYEKRWFDSAESLNTNVWLNLHEQSVLFGKKLIFEYETCRFAVEICEDLWSVEHFGAKQAMGGANLLFNLSASNELVGKNDYRKQLLATTSAKYICGYVYASSGASESTTDLLFSGSTFIYENGTLLKEGERFSFDSQLIYSDIDIERLNNERYRNTSFKNELDFETILLKPLHVTETLVRSFEPYPFIPKNNQSERLQEIIHIQSYALAKRLMHIQCQKMVIGLSGGLDSTLAILVLTQVNKILKQSSKNIVAVTMPGFGTSGRTYQNALLLAKALNVELREIDIQKATRQHFLDIGHDENIHDTTYENAQARERTQILMDIANQVGGIVIGTGDLSELALGYCTYNGDHMSMYGINASIPKTLIKSLVTYFMEILPECNLLLQDILDTPISPELLPTDTKGNIQQVTEERVGPYALHDFFLYYFLRYGFSVDKIYYLASLAFKDTYDAETIKKWLTIFIKRFFTQQFKRNCTPDSIKVGSVSLSFRGDFRMPSDASYHDWLSKS